MLRPLWIILIAMSAVSCSEPPAVEPPPVPRVKTFVIGETAEGQIRRISGKLVSADSSILSFGVSGTIETVNVSEGQTVVEGQVLASLQKAPFEIAVNNARAELSIARAKLNEKQKRFKRMQELLEKSAVARADFEIAEAELGTARGNLKSAESNLESVTRDLAKTTLNAPFPGRLARRSIDPFQETIIGEEAFLLESEGLLQVEVLVPETMIRNVDHGQAVQVNFPTLENVQVNGEVVEISSRVQAGNAFPVKIQLGASTADLRPGMSAAVLFNFNTYLENEVVYLVPLAAIAIEAALLSNYGKDLSQRKDTTAPLFVFDKTSSTIRLRDVRVGDLRGNLLEVFEGLEAGDHVVTAGVAFLEDNMEVRLWDPEQGLVD